ncbi:MAG TPA: hypothetical protein VLG12_07460 [Candidatus Saccharimonadales bacterium]|nr:hypothetical protein [Candidatus Saccharimonadales bacterium]
MLLTALNCSQCEIIIYRSKQRINESKKFGWLIYCSSVCKSLAKTSQKLLQCENPLCKKSFLRSLKEIKKVKHFYCSRTCAVTINNTKFPKRQAVSRLCYFCSTAFIGKEKYCSKDCKNKGQTINKESIIEALQQFYRTNERIPVKREFSQSRAAYCRFGSWNNAIIAAGFDPNPVLFAKKHIAKDGHKCDSLAEKIIDDWLFKRTITHERSVPYGQDHMTADFKINDIFIEFLGLKGVSKVYDRNLLRKSLFWEKHGLKVVTIYPRDLFPKNNLEEIFSFCLKKQWLDIFVR